MKKSTLISTLAMVVIVALALTTATFAWYTANNEVTANSSATAATASDANLAIGTSSNPTTSTPIVLNNSANLAPMAPKTDWKTATGSETTFGTAKGDLYSSAITAGANATFTTSPTAASTPITGKLFVKNLSAGASVNLTVALTATTIDGVTDGTGMLRVAIFTGASDAAKYEGLLAVGSNPVTKWGEIQADKAVSAMEATSVAAAASLTNFVTLGANTTGASDAEVEINYIAWLDGELLDTDHQGAGCNFVLTFTGTVVP